MQKERDKYDKKYRSTPEGRARSRKWYQNNKKRVRWLAIYRTYGITEKAFKSMLKEQRDRCAICGDRFSDEYGKVVVIDHDHTTGKVRGIIHRNCNVGLGMFDDDPELLRLAAEYLERKAEVQD